MPNGPAITPVNELSSGESRLGWNLPLPTYVEEQLGVNLPAIDALSQWGALGAVTLTHSTTKKEGAPAIGGIGGSGTATVAASLGFPSRPKEIAWGSNRLVRRTDTHFLSDAIVGIDTTGLSDRLSAAGRLNDINAWSRELNKAARRGLVGAAATHLTTRYKWVDALAVGMDLFLTAQIQTDDSMRNTTPDHRLSTMVADLAVMGFALPAVFRAVCNAGWVRSQGESLTSVSKVPWALGLAGFDRLVLLGLSTAKNRKLIQTLS